MKNTLAAVALLTVISAVSAHAESCKKECADLTSNCPEDKHETTYLENGTFTYDLTTTPISGPDGSGDYPDCRDCDAQLVFVTPVGSRCMRENVTVHFIRKTYSAVSTRNGEEYPTLTPNPASGPCILKWWTSGASTDKCTAYDTYYLPTP